MKRILTTAFLAVAIIASPAAARLSQPGPASATVANDNQVAPTQPERSYFVVQRAKPGIPTSTIVREPRSNVRPMAMAMMSCCPKSVGTPMQNLS